MTSWVTYSDQIKQTKPMKTLARNITLPSTILTAVLSLALVGCSSTPTKVNSGAIKASTFNFVSNNYKPEVGFTDERAPVHALIQTAIADNLAAKGLTRAQGNTVGDVTVAYLVIIGNNVSTTSVKDYFGYARDYAALAEKAHDIGTDSKNPNYFEAGTLVIDILDSRSGRLLWRNYVTRPTLRDKTQAVRQAAIQEAVNDALKNLRVAK
jgi:hypothetical protein